MIPTPKYVLILAVILTLTIISAKRVAAQSTGRVAKVERIVADSAQLKQYNAALAQMIRTTMHTEQGAVVLTAVYDKANPTHITIVEVFSSQADWQQHLQSAYYRKYREVAAKAVRSQQWEEATPIAVTVKPADEPADLATP